MSETKSTMRCPICDKKNWHVFGNVAKDEPIAKDWPNLQACTNCAFLGYEVDEAKEAEMLDFYRKDYRSAPDHRNLLTTSNKLNYLMAYLNDFLTEAEKNGKQLVCGDVGCATGYLPNALRKRGHKATGSEYTVRFRRFSESFYGVPISEELPTKHKYDLITSYHTLEHMIAPDKKLEKWRDMLADDGRILVACPEWFADLEIQSGEVLGGVGHYFHKNHINAFTTNSIKRLIAKAGLIVEFENHVTYGQTYFLRKAVGDECQEWEADKIDDIKKKVADSIAAIQFFRQNKFDEAISMYEKFPEAHLGRIYTTYAKDPGAQEHHFDVASKLMPGNTRIASQYASWLFQNERFPEARDVYNKLMQVRPGADHLHKLGWIALHLKEWEEAITCFTKVAELQPQSWADCMNLACKAASEIPHWEERGKAEAMKMFAQKAGETKVNLKDAVMEGTK